MHIKTKIKKLTEELEHVKKLVENVTIDIDDYNYAIYVPAEWDEELEYFECLMFKKKPVNRTAINFELDKLYALAHRKTDLVDDWEAEYDRVYGDIPEYNILKNLPTEPKKRIYTDDPDYLIYKFDSKYNSDAYASAAFIYDKYVPYNKAAKEYERKYGAYCFRKRCNKSDALRGLKPNDDWDEDT